MQPKRGEVWKVDFGLAGKVRPAVVVSVAAMDADRLLFCVVPHPTSLSGSRFEIVAPVGFLSPGAFLVQGIANFAIGRFDRRLGILNQPQMGAIEEGLRLLLGL